jgi:hypothetical protein
MRPELPVAKPVQPSLSELADACLGYLAENPEELMAFMEQAGLDPQSLRAAVGSQRLQAGLVDYFAANESILLALCANLGISPETFMRVWYKLNPNG